MYARTNEEEQALMEHVPELFSTLNIFGGLRRGDFDDLPNTHGLLCGPVPSSLIIKDTPTQIRTIYTLSSAFNHTECI